MKRFVTRSVRIEHAERSLHCLHLTCRTEKGRSIDLSISYDPEAPHRSTAYQRYQLVLNLLEWQGISTEQGWATNMRALIGCFYKFRLIEFAPKMWAIDAGKAVEPFEIFDADSDENCAALERALGVPADVC